MRYASLALTESIRERRDFVLLLDPLLPGHSFPSLPSPVYLIKHLSVVAVHVESELLAEVAHPVAPLAVALARAPAVLAPLGPHRFGKHGAVHHVGAASV